MLVELTNSPYGTENIQLKKFQNRMLKIFATALLESIDLFIAMFNVYDN